MATTPPEGACPTFTLNSSQKAFWLSTERYVDLEGGVRSGKTTVAILKLAEYLTTCPGIHCLAARWTQEATDAQLKAKIKELLGPLLLEWNSQEQYYRVRAVEGGESMLYVRGLKPSEDAARYVKIAGLTLAVVYVDQPEEMPEDFHRALQARLSQPGYPQRLIYTPNPPGHDHWLARDFPLENSRPDYRYIRTTVYHNRAVLGEDYIRALEDAYPTPAERRFFIDGLRGLSVRGTPVYQGVFDRKRHVAEVDLNPEVPLLEAWDFGHTHPAVLWAQLLPWGELRILGELMGRDQFLEDFAPVALAARNQLFRQPLDILSTCDPAGAAHSSHGLSKNAVTLLFEHGVRPVWVDGANQPALRDTAIQRVAQYALRHTAQGPGLRVHPRCATLIDGLEAGYVWDERSLQTAALPNTRRPKKDGHYDHLQNCLEYLVLAFGGAQPTRKEAERVRVAAMAAAQRDLDPYDLTIRQRALYHQGRGGY